MKVLLLQPFPQGPFGYSVPPLGLGYLATSLLRRDIDVEILDLASRRFGLNDLRRALSPNPPDLVGIQVYSRELDNARQLVSLVRRELGAGAPIVVGGPHPSTMPEEALDHLPGVNYALAGEGEDSLPMLARRVAGDTTIDFTEIPGLVSRDGSGVHINPSRFRDDINDLGFPAWSLMKLSGYRTEVFGGGFSGRRPAMTLLTSRGCPYKCAFCSAQSLSGGRLRLRHPEAVVEEMSILSNCLGFREIKIIDDNFNVDRNHVLRISELFTRRALDATVTFACGLHLQHLDGEVLRALRAMNAYELMVAIESGSERVLDLMNKKVNLKRLPEQIELIRRHGFRVVAFFLLGYPGETREEMRQTVDLALRLPLNRAHFNCFSPPPGTTVYEELKAQGRLNGFEPRHVQFETFNYSFVDGMNVKQLNRFRQKALFRFFLRPKIFLSLWRTFHRWSSIKFMFYKVAQYFGVVQ
jgi:radical SAM superfamily enzyme YgiQ (UPF0313 family)